MVGYFNEVAFPLWSFKGTLPCWLLGAVLAGFSVRCVPKKHPECTTYLFIFFEM